AVTRIGEDGIIIDQREFIRGKLGHGGETIEVGNKRSASTGESIEAGAGGDVGLPLSHKATHPGVDSRRGCKPKRYAVALLLHLDGNPLLSRRTLLLISRIIE